MQFVGGIDMNVRFKGDIAQDQVRAALRKGGITDAGVVAYENKEGFKDYSIKVKAKEGQDVKDSTRPDQEDPGQPQDPGPRSAKNDPRPDLNTEAVGDILDTWVKANPLAAAGRRAGDPG